MLNANALATQNLYDLQQSCFEEICKNSTNRQTITNLYSENPILFTEDCIKILLDTGVRTTNNLKTLSGLCDIVNRSPFLNDYVLKKKQEDMFVFNIYISAVCKSRNKHSETRLIMNNLNTLLLSTTHLSSGLSRNISRIKVESSKLHQPQKINSKNDIKAVLNENNRELAEAPILTYKLINTNSNVNVTSTIIDKVINSVVVLENKILETASSLGINLPPYLQSLELKE